MTKHLKREAAPKNWPIARKGNAFVVKNASKGIPILVVLRDMLKIAQNRKEVKMAIHKKQLVVSGKPVRDEKQSLELFDTLEIIPSKENFRLNLNKHGKYACEKIEKKNSTKKVSKVIGKKVLRGKKVQLNLIDGRNYLYDKDVNVNDSVLIDLEKNSISKVLPVKEKANVLVIAGKHSGESGKISKIIPERKMVEVSSDEGKFNALIKQIMVTE